MLARFEVLETNYINKEEELRNHLSWFIFDQSQLAKTYRRDVEDLNRLQQEHLSKLEINSNLLSFDELLQQQVNKYYHYRNTDDDEDDDDMENINNKVKLIQELEKLHDEHFSWLKKKKKDMKIIGPIVERLRMFRVFHSSDFILYVFCFSSRGTLRSFTNARRQINLCIFIRYIYRRIVFCFIVYFSLYSCQINEN